MSAMSLVTMCYIMRCTIDDMWDIIITMVAFLALLICMLFLIKKLKK